MQRFSYHSLLSLSKLPGAPNAKISVKNLLTKLVIVLWIPLAKKIIRYIAENNVMAKFEENWLKVLNITGRIHNVYSDFISIGNNVVGLYNLYYYS